MITSDNPSINSTEGSIHHPQSGFWIRELQRRKEDAIAHEKYQKERIEKLTKDNQQLVEKTEVLSLEKEALAKENARLLALLKENGIKAD